MPSDIFIIRLQQLLPFTVLKPNNGDLHVIMVRDVATALTVYGIETISLRYK